LRSAAEYLVYLATGLFTTTGCTPNCELGEYGLSYDADGDGEGNCNPNIYVCSREEHNEYESKGYVVSDNPAHGSPECDCDDNNFDVNDAVEEICDNETDDNCDGQIDEMDDQCIGARDNDGDGFSTDEGDCDDNDASVNPGVEDIAENGIDENCNGYDGDLTVGCGTASYPTIQAAIDEAEISSSDQTVFICSGTYNECGINLYTHENDLLLAGESNTTVEGTTLEGPCGSTTPFIYADSGDGAKITIRNLNFDATDTSGTDVDGGGILFDSSGNPGTLAVNLKVDLCNFTNNELLHGGAIAFLNGANLTVTRSVFTNNTPSYSSLGGAIYFQGNNLEILESTFAYNQSQMGGAIFLDIGASTTIENSSLYANESPECGGAVYMDISTSLTSTDTEWYDNSPDDICVGETSFEAGSDQSFTCSADTATCE